MIGAEIATLVIVVILFIVCCVIAGRCSKQLEEIYILKRKTNEQNKMQHKMYEQEILSKGNKDTKKVYKFQTTVNTLLDANGKEETIDEYQQIRNNLINLLNLDEKEYKYEIVKSQLSLTPFGKKFLSIVHGQK